MSQSDRGESAASSQVAPDGGQARCNTSGKKSAPLHLQNKRRRRPLPYSDPRVDNLITQVSYISNFDAHINCNRRQVDLTICLQDQIRRRIHFL